MIEEIGKIKLDLEHYPGEDKYCDGDVEDELLEIARNYAEVEYPRIIEERKSWEVLYHLSSFRENIVEWLPIDKSMKVLEVGSGCGAITGALARKAGEVTCIDLSKKRSMINAYRHMGCGNVTIHVGNFQDIEPDLPCDYDYICLIGVFEYGQAYIDSPHPYEDFLRIIAKHKKKEGHIAIAIENKFGLKYWAGCKEDHLGSYFSGLEDYPDGGVVRTFTKDGLMKIAKECGFSDISMYYPYPDYKFMTTLYSDERLPRPGELSSNLRNFDRERLLLFNEKLVFDTIIKEGCFPLFSNSYMMILGTEHEVKYARYSNDRTDAYKIKTLLTKRELEGKTTLQIEKHALSKEAHSHIRQLYQNYEKLKERFVGGAMQINRCSLPEGDGAYAAFEYIEGTTLQELLDACLERNDIDKFHALFDEYLEKIAYHDEMPVTDYDLVFSNILISDDGKWHVTDYEWAYEKVVETREIAFRAVYCYLLEDEKRNKLNLDLILDKLGVTQEDAQHYREQEMKFQKYVTGKRMALAEIREAINQPVYTIEDLITSVIQKQQKNQIQIYEDTGDGFTEEQSFFIEKDATLENMQEFQLTIGKGRKALRIDPGDDPCIVWLREIKWNDTPLALRGKRIITNGIKTGKDVYVFAANDPNITLQLSDLEQRQENLLTVSMQVTGIPEETGKHMHRKGLFE
ncbi:MAG: methyltransferase domain-containing protein [Blautia sp.]|nr:methyltransferase domain-containing protein [Lachnoclostridium sp.]MCM1211022.1 methyltransferase domain-containing protein [Blautia sp.]